MSAPAFPTRFRREFDEFLRGMVASTHPELLYRMVRYHLGWEDERGEPAEHPGKGLRPAFCLLACEATGGEWRQALPAAAAVELVHNFSLVHDDIQDRDTERHHRPAVWTVWGEAQAINAGDALLALAHEAVLRLADAGVPAAQVVAAAKLLGKRTLEMVEGQVLDIGFEEALDVTLDAYLEMISKKTGALFDCALALGGLAAGADERTVGALGRCGRLLGVAFQARDDMLGVWGAENRTGKPPASDIRRRKKSLPVVYALAESDADSARELRRIYSGAKLSDEDVSHVLHAMDAAGAHAFCAQLAEDKKLAALAELDRLQLNADASEELRGLARFLLERDF